MGQLIHCACLDIQAAFQKYALVGRLGWQDISQRYRRSVLGPFWLTLSMGVMIASIGLVFSQVFRSPIHEFLPFLAIGIMVWNFISTTLTEGCTGFITAESMMKQLPLPLFIHLLRVIWRNSLISAHHLAILPVVFFAVGHPIHAIAWSSLLGFILLIINLTWASLILAIICTRYRDFPPIVASVLQIIFYMTPVLWMPGLVTGKKINCLIQINPLYHAIELIRSPLLGKPPPFQALCVMLCLTCVGWLLTLLVYGRYRNRIIYWL